MNLEEIISNIFQTQNQAIILRAAVSRGKRQIDNAVRSAIVRYVDLMREDLEFAGSVSESLPDALCEWTTKNSYDWMVLNLNEIEVQIVHYGGTDQSAIVLPIRYVTNPEEFDLLKTKLYEFKIQKAALRAAQTRQEEETFRQRRYEQYLKLKQEFEPG